jgi:hypothetical protein
MISVQSVHQCLTDLILFLFFALLRELFFTSPKKRMHEISFCVCSYFIYAWQVHISLLVNFGVQILLLVN